MNGGPSQVDLFDPKPSLEKYAGKPPGRDLANDIEFINEAGGFMPSPFKFAHHGKSGVEISEAMPHLTRHADDIALIRSMFTPHFNHEPSIFMMQSGRQFSSRPTIGFLGRLWSRKRESEPTGLRRPGRSQGTTHQPHPELAIRLAASNLPRHSGTLRGLAAAEFEGEAGVPGASAGAGPVALVPDGSRASRINAPINLTWEPASPTTSWQHGCN